MSKTTTTYRDSGVDIEKAESSLNRLKDKIEATHSSHVLKGIGQFGGFFDISDHGLEHPVLVSSTDGVGTKLRVAMLANRHDSVGQDLVNHCINDIAVCGAKPLYFLDYFASGMLEPGVYEAVISGVAEGCAQAGISLVGGETAEMPDFYDTGDYDLCGTIVGIVDRQKIIDGSKIAPGDVLLGVSGNGLHTNGYTLARHVLLNEYEVGTKVDSLGHTIEDELLRIHPNYFQLIDAVCEKAEIHGMSHVTGGGILKNTQRVLPAGAALSINWDAWEMPPVFRLIQELGNVPAEDMQQTFNLGIGMVFITRAENAAAAKTVAGQIGFDVMEIGSVTKD